jgi:hypothetical protein
LTQLLLAPEQREDQWTVPDADLDNWCRLDVGNRPRLCENVETIVGAASSRDPVAIANLLLD